MRNGTLVMARLPIVRHDDVNRRGFVRLPVF